MSKGDARAWYAFSICFEALGADWSFFTAFQLEGGVSKLFPMLNGSDMD